MYFSFNQLNRIRIKGNIMEINELVKFNINPKEIKEFVDRAKNMNKIIAVTGEFNSGKTSFINALINKRNFLKVGDTECTPVLVELVNGKEENIEVIYKDNSRIKDDFSKENIAKYTQYTEEYDTNILGVTIPLENTFIGENVFLIDTPGTNTILRGHEEITSYILKRADIVLYVINKVICESDLYSIKEARKYTNNIIFIITHLDENINGTYVNRTEESLKSIMEEGQNKLQEVLNEEIDIFPVGSEAAFEDSSYVDNIIEAIKYYVSANKEEVIKSRICNQLSILFEEKIKEMKDELNLIEEIKSKDKESLISTINKIERKMESIRANSDKVKKEVYEDSLTREKILISQFTDLFEKEKNKVLNQLLNKEDVSQELIDESLGDVCEKTGEEVRKLIEDYINKTISRIFENTNEELEKLMNDIDIPINLGCILSIPKIEELSAPEYYENINRIKREQDKAVMEMAVTLDDLENLEASKDEALEKIQQYEQNKSQLNREFSELGSYKAEYNEVYEEGAEETGAFVGKIVGEVADIALMLWNPGAGAGTVVKGADAAQGLIKGANMVNSAVQNTSKFSKVVKGVQTTAKMAKGAKNTLNKVGKMVEETKENNNSKNYGHKIMKALEYLQLSTHGENLGRKIGGIIQPSKTVLIEDEEVYAEYFSKKESIEKAITDNIEYKKEIDKELYENKISMAAARKKHIAIKAELDGLKREEERILSSIEKMANEDKQEKLNNYYTLLINNIFENEINNVIEMSKSVLSKINESIVLNNEELVDKKLYSLKENLMIVLQDKEKIENEILAKRENLNEISSYKEWIDEWVK